MRTVAAALLVALLTAGAAHAQELRRLPAVVHVHSDRSTGDSSYEQLITLARRQGVEALLLTEEQILRIEYSFAPFRSLTRVVHEERSVFVTGVEGYLARVAEARRKDPGVILVAGVEVLPHYQWRGSLTGGAITLWNHQKNLHVFGLTDAGRIRALPSAGNPHTARYAWQSVVDALPVLLLIPGAILIVRPRQQRHRVGRAIVIVRRRRWILGGLLTLLGVVGLVRGWPFTVDRHPFWTEPGLEPYQALIDEADRLGGVTMWSFPEAFDEGRRRIGPVNVFWRTDPHGDDLLRTVRYTAFGAIYPHTTRITDPGAGWDRLLMHYAAGERSRPAWATGETGAHGMGQAADFGTIQTVFLVRDRSEAGILEAFRAGRMYALQRTHDAALSLSEWTVVAGDAAAASGDTLRVPEGTPIEVRLAVEATAPGAHGVRATLVRNGAVVAVWPGDAGVRATHREVFDGRPLVFRVESRARTPHRLVANPIFVTRP